MTNKITLLLLAFLFSINIAYAKKISVIIAVGDYPKKGQWGDISSVKDIPLIKNTLLNQGFLEENIYVIKDKKATKKGILTLLEKVKTQLQEGDILMIHYSGHGQQIFDQNGDEIDDLDEAIVPYDANAFYSDDYQGENHIRDDELGNIFNQFRNKLGKEGQLIVTFDSCHSGSSTRGITRGGQPAFVPKDWKPSKKHRGKGSGMMEKVTLSNNASPFVFISGASANELNYEYKGNGSLSYALSKAFNELKEDFTYRQLFAKISSIMASVAGNQTPTIEGDINYTIFSGDYVAVQPNFSVNKIEGGNKIIINGGKIHRLFKETTVFVTKSTATKPEESNILAKGVITESNNLTATILLDKVLPTDNIKDFIAFVDEPTFEQLQVNVWLDNPLSENDKDAIKTKFKNEKFVSIVKDSALSKVYISKGRIGYTLNTFSNAEPLVKNLSLDDLDEKLFTFAQGNYLKSLHMENEDYAMEIELLKLKDGKAVENNGTTPRVIATVKSKGIVGDKAILRVINKGNFPFYFSIIEIYTLGQYAPIIPNSKCRLSKDDRKVAPGKTIKIPCDITFGPPYEKVILKAFASKDPINFSDLRSRGPKNPLEGIVTRSSSRGIETESANVDGYSTEFVYEIVKE